MFDMGAEYAAFARDAALDWEALAGKAVLVTGATGLIGSCVVRLLAERNRTAGAGIRIVALVRSVDKAQAMLGEYGGADGLEIVQGDVRTFDGAGLKRCDYVIHAACPTASRFFMEHPVDTALTIVDGTRNMLDVARGWKCESFVYISSMEVYGDGNSQPGLGHKLTEADVGYVNPLSMRSCYPEGKRMAEHLTCAYASQYGMRAQIVRLAQTFGPGIPVDDVRVFAQFARCAMNGEDIVLRTTGASTRMYSYPADAVAGILTVLLEGEAGRAYNLANESTYSSVYEMAQTVARECAGGSIEVRVEVDPDAPYPPEHHLPLDTSALRALGWGPTVDLPHMYERLIAYLEE